MNNLPTQKPSISWSYNVDMSSSNVYDKYSKPYEEQLQRTIRLQQQAHKFAEPDNQNFEEAVDCFTNFLIQSWSLRDWLMQSGFDKNELEEYVNNDKYLILCKDMANHQKHQKITRYTPQNDFITGEVVMGVTTPISKSWDPFSQKSFFGIMAWNIGKPVDVIEVIDKCVESWQQYISKK